MSISTFLRKSPKLRKRKRMLKRLSSPKFHRRRNNLSQGKKSFLSIWQFSGSFGKIALLKKKTFCTMMMNFSSKSSTS